MYTYWLLATEELLKKKVKQQGSRQWYNHFLGQKRFHLDHFFLAEYDFFSQAIFTFSLDFLMRWSELG